MQRTLPICVVASSASKREREEDISIDSNIGASVASRAAGAVALARLYDGATRSYIALLERVQGCGDRREARARVREGKARHMPDPATRKRLRAENM